MHTIRSQQPANVLRAPGAAARQLQQLVERHAYLWSITIVVVVTAALWVVQHELQGSLVSISPIYLVAVLLCAITAGRWPAMLSAGFSFVLFKFFFVAPIYTFTVDDAEDISRLLIFLATAFLAGGMAVRLREQATEAQRRADEAAVLYDLSQAISSQLDFGKIAPLFVATARRLLGSPGCRLLLASPAGDLSLCAEDGLWTPLASVMAAPLRSGSQLLGELQIISGTVEGALVAEQQRLLETLANQAALALERSLLSQAAAQTEALAASDRLKSTLLSTISHDVRTPLASIVAAAEELRADDVAWSPSAIRDFGQMIETQARRLHHLMTNLLDLSRIEAGALRPQRGWYNIAEIIHSVLDRLAAELAERPLELLVVDDLPLVPIDYVQLEQVLWNILENALKYSPPTSPITIAAAMQDATLRIQIGDRGPGIPHAERTRVFEKFYRLPQPEGVSMPGTGIGLAICKGLIDAHGGQIAILGREGGGTLVEICLPLQAPQPALPASQDVRLSGGS